MRVEEREIETSREKVRVEERETETSRKKRDIYREKI